MILHHLIFTTLFVWGQAQFWDYELSIPGTQDYGLNEDDLMTDSTTTV